MSLDNAIIARLKKGGASFEIWVNPNTASSFKANPDTTDINDVLEAAEIYADAKKGQIASANEMKKVFDSDDPLVVAKEILTKGEVQVTADQRRAEIEKVRKQILDHIASNAVDPKTHLPHPLQRLELAFEEARIKIDEHKSVEAQTQEIIKKLQPILPLKFETDEVIVKIPANYAGKAYPIAQSFGKLIKDEWQNDGSWLCGIEIPAGKKADFFGQLNSLTHGEVETIQEKQIR